jgi:hypothetical protein
LTPNWSPRTSLVNWNVVSTFVALSRWAHRTPWMPVPKVSVFRWLVVW